MNDLERAARVADRKAAALNGAADSMSRQSARDRRDMDDLERMESSLRASKDVATEIAASIRTLKDLCPACDGLGEVGDSHGEAACVACGGTGKPR